MPALFCKQWPFFKGNLHCHTTLSDGQKTPEEVIALYKQAGYDFLAITDHHQVFWEKRVDQFLVITGVEYHYVYPQGPRLTCHWVGIGMDKDFLYDRTLLPLQMAHRIHAHGGLAILAHPVWSFMDIQDMAALPADGVEVYNTGAEVSSFRGDCAALLDIALQKGFHKPLVASDDAHHYERDHCQSAVFVNCPTLSYENIKEAILKRRFYAVTAQRAPRIKDIRFDGEKLRCIAENCGSIGFISDVFGAAGRVVYAQSGQCFEGVYTPGKNDRFIRIECRNAFGRAYTSYFSISDISAWHCD